MILNSPEQPTGCEHPDHRKGKVRVAEVLSQAGLEVEFEHQWWINSIPYSSDIYLPDYHICIECDGKSHDGKINKWRDSMKDDLINSLGNRTVRVDLGDAIDYPYYVLRLVKDLISQTHHQSVDVAQKLPA